MMGMHTCPTVPSPTLEGCAMFSGAAGDTRLDPHPSAEVPRTASLRKRYKRYTRYKQSPLIGAARTPAHPRRAHPSTGCASPAADTRPAAPPRRQLTPLRIIFHTLQGVVERWGGTDNPHFHSSTVPRPLCGGRCGCGEKGEVWKTGLTLATLMAAKDAVRAAGRRMGGCRWAGFRTHAP
jgi:hypothetical protein